MHAEVRWSPPSEQPDKLNSFLRRGGRDGGKEAKRRRYGAEFKAKVALEALKGELTIAQLVAKHGVHQTLIYSWKRQAMERMALFFGNAEAEVTDREAQFERLHARIGELVVERGILRNPQDDERRPE